MHTYSLLILSLFCISLRSMQLLNQKQQHRNAKMDTATHPTAGNGAMVRKNLFGVRMSTIRLPGDITPMEINSTDNQKEKDRMDIR